MAGMGGDRRPARAGADVGAGRGGNTPLHAAAYGGHAEAIAALLRAGADVGAKAYDGRTPLALAQVLKHEQAAELLRRHGAQ